MLLSDRLAPVEEHQEQQGQQDAFEERMGVQEGALALLMQDYASSPSSSSDATDTTVEERAATPASTTRRPALSTARASFLQHHERVDSEHETTRLTMNSR